MDVKQAEQGTSIPSEGLWGLIEPTPSALLVPMGAGLWAIILPMQKAVA